MSKNHENNPKPPKTADPVSVRDLGDGDRPIRRTFPGPRGAEDILRVAVDRSAYADLVSHAKSSLSAEVCGVLVGRFCEDDEGPFVHVEAVIAGTAAGEGSTHVTFTQETWNGIHRVLEKDHPKLKIVGWYHTHPGFGVEFSEMDLFIQRNFFAGPAQVALVTDPVNGDVAICLNTDKGIENLRRFWIDGREQQCRAPRRTAASGENQGAAPGADTDAIRDLEARVGQLVQSLDKVRNFHYSFMMFCGGVFCLALITAAAYSIYSQMNSKLEPPKLNQTIPFPIQIGDKEVILGVAVTSWQVPPELNSLMLQIAEKQAREAEAAKEATNPAGETPSNAPPAATNAAPPAHP